MTQPCIDPTYFDATDGVVSPHPWLQWRQVATGTAGGTLTDPLTDTAEILIHDLIVAWTNDTPISQHAYGICTRSATQIVVTANKVFGVETRRGWASGSSPADPATTMLTTRHGGGIDLGLFETNSIYGVWENRQGSRSTPIGPDVVLTPGQTIKLRAAVYVVRDAWSPPPSPAFQPEQENFISSGDTQIDIFAYPVIP